MKLAIMQPYFFPYLGYFQLINAVDVFVVYDNIQYTKKGWINRNRILLNGKGVIFTIPLKKASDYLNVYERELASDFNKDKLIRKLQTAYSKAPHFNTVFNLVEKIIHHNSINLFEYIYNSINAICNYLNINTNIIISSKIDINHELRGQDKVLEICKALEANSYINAIGGISLYKTNDFARNNIDLYFLKTNIIKYKQNNSDFIPNLSIIDVMMYNSKDSIMKMLEQYILI